MLCKGIEIETPASPVRVHELERWRSKAHATLTGLLCEATCGESTLARVSQTIYFIAVWPDTNSTAIPLSQRCTKSLCFFHRKKMFWSCSNVLPGARKIKQRLIESQNWVCNLYKGSSILYNITLKLSWCFCHNLHANTRHTIQPGMCKRWQVKVHFIANKCYIFLQNETDGFKSL